MLSPYPFSISWASVERGWTSDWYCFLIFWHTHYHERGWYCVFVFTSGIHRLWPVVQTAKMPRSEKMGGHHRGLGSYRDCLRNPYSPSSFPDGDKYPNSLLYQEKVSLLGVLHACCVLNLYIYICLYTVLKVCVW